MKLKDIKKINEEYYNGVYYCVVTLKNGKQYYKTNTRSMKDNEFDIVDIMETGHKWRNFMNVLNNIKVS